MTEAVERSGSAANVVPIALRRESTDKVDGLPRVWRAMDLSDAACVEWLASKRIPLAALTYFLGPEGIGKSLWTVWLTARITTGTACPEFGLPARTPRIVVLVITEDDWSTVVRPRLEVAGADLEYVRVICADEDGSGAPTFPLHMPIVEEACDNEDVAAVIVDAWADTLPGGLAAKDPQQARRALHPWKELATRTGAAVILCGHTNREKSGTVRNAYGVTGELRKKARMTLLAQPVDPEDDTLVMIGPEKSNLTRTVEASIFRKTSVQAFEPTEDSDGTVPRLVWEDNAGQTAAAAFAEAADRDEDPAAAADQIEATAWLEDYLLENGQTAAKEVKASARKEIGASESAIKRAASKLNVRYEISGFPRTSRWSLPTPDGGDSDA